MAAQRRFNVGISGLTTLYVSLFRQSDGFNWNSSLLAWEAENPAHITSGAYSIALTERGATGVYKYNVPAQITLAELYDESVRLQAGGSPAWPTDQEIGNGSMPWTGTAMAIPTNYQLATDSSGRVLLQPTQTGVTIPTVTAVTNAVAITSNVKKNQALAAFGFTMTDSTNHLPAPMLTVTATRSLDGGAFAACANAPSAIASGDYSINLASTDMNANVVILRFTATGADDLNVTIITQP